MSAQGEDKRYPYPALVISLDFELHWGFVDCVHGPEHPYWKNLLCSRRAVEEMLSIFMKYDIHATWLTVGILFARNQKEFGDFVPAVKPEYKRRELDPYAVAISNDEMDDPLHYAASLVEKIRRTPGQELGSHTFSHYYCLEEGQTKEAFREDLLSAKAIGSKYGVTLRSFAFPRNQVNPAYFPIISEVGFETYRGNQKVFPYNNPGNKYCNSLFVRLPRFADAYFNLTGHHTIAWSELNDTHPLNVRASCFLRPCTPELGILDKLRHMRVVEGLRYAAEKGEIFHLWWHPHNLGLKLEHSLSQLEEILKEFDSLRRIYGMRSLNMSEVADEVYRIRSAEGEENG
jgi:peptidoglycan/xylan/chitin deacetylase (PgdA/CDA1 family)